MASKFILKQLEKLISNNVWTNIVLHIIITTAVGMSQDKHSTLTYLRYKHPAQSSNTQADHILFLNSASYFINYLSNKYQFNDIVSFTIIYVTNVAIFVSKQLGA